jgi:hypothetical protein
VSTRQCQASDTWHAAPSSTKVVRLIGPPTLQASHAKDRLQSAPLRRPWLRLAALTRAAGEAHLRSCLLGSTPHLRSQNTQASSCRLRGQPRLCTSRVTHRFYSHRKHLWSTAVGANVRRCEGWAKDCTCTVMAWLQDPTTWTHTNTRVQNQTHPSPKTHTQTHTNAASVL